MGKVTTEELLGSQQIRLWLHWPASMCEQGVPKKNALLSVKLPCEQVFPKIPVSSFNLLMRKLPFYMTAF